jgi:outer membrane protein assembly factor BamB
MISAEQFIDLLENKDLLPGDLVTRLRVQITQSGKPIPAEAVARRLIEKGYLTPALVKRLLGSGPEKPSAAPSEKRPAAPPPEDEDFGFAPLPEDKPKPAAKSTKTPPPADEDDLGLIPLDDLPEKGPSRPTGKPAPGKTGKPTPTEDDGLGLIPLDEPPAKPAAPKKPPASAAPKATKPRAAEKPVAKPPAKPAQKAAPPTRPSGGSLLDEELPAAGDLGSVGLTPLDGLLDEHGLEAGSPLTQPPSAGSLGPLAAAAEEKPAEKKKVEKKTKDTSWDSPLMLVGGGALLGFLILGGVLVWVFMRQGGDELLRQANQDYLAGSYTQAIHKYGIYLTDYPTYPGASLAKVRRGLAQMRQAADKSLNWPKALDVAHEVLKEIAPEREFKNEAQKELTALLPAIAQGLAQQAREAHDPALVAKTKDALAMVDHYIPKSMRPATKLADIQALLALTEREIARTDELKKAVGGMRAAIKAGKTEEAYRLRDALLKQYPSLTAEKDLQEVVLEVSRAAQAAVKNVDEKREAVREDPPAKFSAALALACRASNAPPPDAEGRVVAVLAEGAAYGLNAADGKVLWRRPVGVQTNGHSPGFVPKAVDAKPGSDVLLVDTSDGRSDVLRVDATNGRLRWRFAVDEPFEAEPVVAGAQVLVATNSGRLLSIDLESGATTGYVQLPQGLRVAPCVDLTQRTIYQIAEHSNLFVLPLGEAGAKQVVHLGHDAGSITAPPEIISHFLIVTVNDAAESAAIRVYTLEGSEKLPPLSLLQEVRVEGYIDTPPLAVGVRLLTVTDRGNLYVFELSASDLKRPLVQVGEGKAAGADQATLPTPQNLVCYPLLLGSQVFIADCQLTRYDLQASRGKLHPKGIQNEFTTTVQPLAAVGQSVVHARRKMGLPGVIVSAMPLDGGRPFWETRLGTPLLGSPSVDAASGQVSAATATGAVFLVEGKALSGVSVVDQPAAALLPTDVKQPLTHAVRWENGLMALASVNGPKEVVVFNPKGEQRQLRTISLTDPVGSAPMALGKGLLVPSKIGQIIFLDPASGVKRTEPFQPRLEKGVPPVWQEPAAINDNEFVLADTRSNLYRIGIKQQPTPHLAPLASATTREPMISPLAVAGTVVYGVDKSKTLGAYNLQDLVLAQQWPLEGRPVWGPRRVGDRVLLATHDEKASEQQLRYRLVCVDADKKLLWQVPLLDGPLAGSPARIGDKYVLASVHGKLWTVDAATGNTAAEADLGLPLGTGPVVLGDQLLIAGHDGTLYQVKQP